MGERRPIVVIFPWLGATPKHIEKYASIYTSVGFRVLVKVPETMDFLWPRRGIQNGYKFLENLNKMMGNEECSIIIHGMSIGCFFYCVLLLIFERQPELFKRIQSNIRCQILDSPVIGSLGKMAEGTAKSVSNSVTIQHILNAFLHFYFGTSMPFTVWYYNLFNQIIKERPLQIPTLLLSSKDDQLACIKELGKVVDCWKQQGVCLTQKVWETSEHCSHLRNFPSLYKDYVMRVLSDAIPEYMQKKSLL
uniref:Uncharacterized protein LOC100186401 n=1 Tax=Phallusia mammillata TaxID=59560 RepID=A0A6F9DIH2_9ASCI|nr:uncharacterized protein LOC100186401 [Phallusia mammillata]